MRRTIETALFLAASVWAVSCDQVIDARVADTAPVVNIDAWITDKPGDQVIYVNRTQNYFESIFLPEGVKGAEITVTDDTGRTFRFEEDNSIASGGYRWKYDGAPLVRTGYTYTLRVSCEGEVYTARSKAGRVPEIDSISFYYTKGKTQIDDRYAAEFWAADLPGTGDSYWIKTYRSGVLLNRPDEINLAYDAGASMGSGLDGTIFYESIRKKITPAETNSDGGEITPIAWGDTLRIEIHSLTDASYTYLNEVIRQTNKTGGLTEVLTATPFVNVSTNIRPENGAQCVGFFNAGTVSSHTRQLNLGNYITIR